MVRNATLTLVIQYTYCHLPYLEAVFSIPNMKKCHIVVKNKRKIIGLISLLLNKNAVITTL